jgi:7-cyano-7-deazaguanine tRNA-ribosyltransferase
MKKSAIPPNGLAIDKTTTINGKAFETPTMMLTYSFRNNNPRPWQFLTDPAIMTNAYDILQNNKLAKRVQKKGIHKELGLVNEICAMDSGGYQFISRGEDEDIDPLEIIDFQIRSKPDIAVSLDYPILSDFSKEKAQLLRKQGLKNIQLSLEHITNGIEVMPVLHGTTGKEISNYFYQVNELGDFNIWGVGGLVPQMKQSKTSHKRYFTIIDRVIEARQKLNSLGEEKLLHLFGVGSPLAGLLFLLCGADSIESISWIMNAKFFLVYQDKIGARKVSKKTTMCTTSVRWEKYSCHCPICDGQSPEIIQQRMKQGGNEGFQNRAMHNAYIYRDILLQAREAIHDNRLIAFCKEKIGKHRFFKGILEYTLKKLEHLPKT